MSRNQLADKEKLLTQLNKIPIVQIACERIGISRATYYRWHKSDQKFAKDCNETIEVGVGMINDMAESQLISAIKEKNMTAIIFWLKHHHGAYETRVRIDARIKSEPEALNPEQAALVANALKLAGLLTAKKKENQ